METKQSVNYGPLKKLLGVWKGDKGLDIAPEPDGIENNHYYETITYKEVGDVTNAESQTLSVIHYRQIVQRKSNDEIFHDETGYWMWDSAAEIIMHSLTIPRAVCILAGGNYTKEDNTIVIEVAASINDDNWQIIQSPFMQKNARTTDFSHKITVSNGKLSYLETTIVEIYGKTFEHTDQNELILQ